MNGTEIYSKLSEPPRNALKTISGGKLKGMTDINPQWRYKAMTEAFGLAGLGWKYQIDKTWTEQGSNGEVAVFAQVSVFIKDGDKWSDAITGVGGSMLVKTENQKLVTNDEGYKMAVTDAFSTSLKMLGVGAAIYEGRWDGSKYSSPIPSIDETDEQKKQREDEQKKKVADMSSQLQKYIDDGTISKPEWKASAEKYIREGNVNGMTSVLKWCEENKVA